MILSQNGTIWVVRSDYQSLFMPLYCYKEPTNVRQQRRHLCGCGRMVMRLVN